MLPYCGRLDCPPLSAWQGQQAATKRWVNAELGSDSNDGTAPFPWKTLNHALDVAYGTPGIKQIRIVATPNTPIAPVSQGGYEAAGWQKPGESGPRAPFPIRLFSGISIRGEVVQGELPRITLNEVVFGEYVDWEPFDWVQDAGLTAPTITHDVGTPRYSYFLPEAGAEDITLHSLWLDGAQLEESKRLNKAAGLWAINNDNLFLVDCKVTDMHDGIVFYSHGDVGAGVKGQLTATIVGGEYSGAWPHVEVAGDKGHAGAWIIGEGFSSVDVLGATLFEGNHDGVEIAGSNGFGTSTTASLTIDRAMFDSNDNGLEIVGPGLAETATSLSHFVDQRNFHPVEPGEGQGVLVRGMSADSKFRACQFRDNTYGINWLCGGPARLDLGTCDDPGGNQFHEFTYPTAVDHYRVHLLNENNASSLSMDAHGNTWIAGTQGADPQNGEMPSVSVTGPANTPPPGPNAGAGQDRNYSIENGAVIDFAGGTCP